MSVPFYRDLAATLGGSATLKMDKLRLVGVFPQNADEVGRFKAREKLEIETVVSAPLADLGVRSTPTMLLVSRQGTILRTWFGAPNKEAQEAITSAFISLWDAEKEQKGSGRDNRQLVSGLGKEPSQRVILLESGLKSLDGLADRSGIHLSSQLSELGQC
jgi:hypothetical protein